MKRPLALSLTVIAAVSRLLPHPPNFTAVGSSSLFAGARLPGWQAYLVPLLAMIVTDPILGAMQGFSLFTWSRVFVYASLMVSVWLGRRLRGTENFAQVGAYALAGSVQFFLITNFSVWLSSVRTYPRSIEGLMACYTFALPFFGRTLAGDLLFSALLFGAYKWLRRPALANEQLLSEGAR